MNQLYQKLEQFERVGARALEIMRDKSFLPESTKRLRTWNLTDVAKIVGKTTKTLREKEDKKLLPPPKIDQTNNKRFYTLEDINNIRKYFGILPRKPDGVPPAIIAFTNFKGGVAKTTSAVHAAHYFAKSGYRTLLIDTDSQASATSSFGFAPDEHIQSTKTLLPFFLGKTPSIKKCIQKTYWDQLDLIPANLKLYEIELELPTIKDRAISKGKKFNIYNILSLGLEQVREDYDVIVIDCPPSMSILNTNALFAANAIIIPCPPELPDVASMIQFFGMIKGAINKTNKNFYSFLKILITKNDSSKSAKSIIAMLRKIYGGFVMSSEMDNTQVIKKARAETKSVYEVSKYSGSKQTLNRALQIIDDVNLEIEELVIEAWSNLSKNKKRVTKKKEVASYV